MNPEEYSINFLLTLFCFVFSKSVFTVQIYPKLFSQLGYETFKDLGGDRALSIWVVLHEVASHCILRDWDPLPLSFSSPSHSVITCYC